MNKGTQLLLILGLVVTLGLGALIAYSAFNSRSSEENYEYTPVEYESTTSSVVYEVSGANEVFVTLQAPTGIQQKDIKTPWLSSGFDFEHGEFLYISAQNLADSGDVTCKIKVDGVVVSENTSSGGYAIASCDATV